ncbi:MAG: hypothetical protein H6625_06700 [Bdellovibrionaceae bacterium]|nr:hypothetical protein [Pseudobdellovibrionaceae bacterium]
MNYSIAIILTFLFVPYAQANTIDFKGFSITFDSAIYSGEISNKFRKYKPYILTASNSDVIGVLECNNSITALGSNYVFLTLTDRLWEQIPIATKVQMETSECMSIVEALANGTSNLKIKTSNEYSYHIGFGRSFLALQLKLIDSK